MAPKSLTWVRNGYIIRLRRSIDQVYPRMRLQVIAKVRNPFTIQHFKEAGASILEHDVSASQNIIDAKAKEALAIYGGIDLLVNNTGYSVLGTLDDARSEKWEEQFKTNVFGVRDGTVVFVGSMGSWNFAVGGPYSSSKFALEGIAETFQLETSHLNIKSIIVGPGYFRTSFLKDSTQGGAGQLIKMKFADYEPITNGLFGLMQAYNGKQPGDPVKAVSRIIDVVKQKGVAAGRDVPPKLILGPDVVEHVGKKYNDTLEMLKR